MGMTDSVSNRTYRCFVPTSQVGGVDWNDNRTGVRMITGSGVPLFPTAKWTVTHGSMIRQDVITKEEWSQRKGMCAASRKQPATYIPSRRKVTCMEDTYGTPAIPRTTRD